MQTLLFFTFEQTKSIMIRFNELRITGDGECLVVDCEIEPIGLYSNMYIDEIRLDYYKNVDSSGLPTTKSFCMYKDGDAETTGLRGVRVSMLDSKLPDTQLGVDTFKNGLFYVTVICDVAAGAPAPTVNAAMLPCGTDDAVNSQAVIDWRGFYERGMQYISSMYGCGADKCEIPAGFEDFILLWNALKAAIAACDWPLVSKLWDRIMRSGHAGSSALGGNVCGCGR